MPIKDTTLCLIWSPEPAIQHPGIWWRPRFPASFHFSSTGPILNHSKCFLPFKYTSDSIDLGIYLNSSLVENSSHVYQSKAQFKCHSILTIISDGNLPICHKFHLHETSTFAFFFFLKYLSYLVLCCSYLCIYFQYQMVSPFEKGSLLFTPKTLSLGLYTP